MKKVFLLIVLFSFSFGKGGGWVFAQNNNFVYLQKKKFMLNGNEYYPVGVNYIVDIVKDPNTGNLYIAPHHGYGTSNDYEHGDAVNSLQEIWDDFYRMKHSMGINSIRLCGLGPVKNPSADGFSFTAITNPYPNPIYTGPPPSTVTFTPPYSGNSSVNQNCATLFSFINSVLSIAADPQIDIKVTLLAGGGSAATTTQRINFNQYNNLTSTNGRLDYKNYLSALSDYFKTNTALFAYDLFNEPLYFDGGNFRKTEVCQMVSDWYQEIKLKAPNHLVTIGLAGPGEVYEWDPGILNLDFISVHTYPSVTNPNNTSEQTLGVNRVFSDLYWFGKNVNKPWIIGETGFSAKVPPLPSITDNPDPVNCTGQGWDYGVDGDYNAQGIFATNSLAFARACGAAGYTWWQYQDVYWGCDVRGSYLGLIDFNDNFKQPAVTAFQNFNPFTVQTPATQPTTYYNYFNWSQNPVTGTVVDNNNVAVQDAVVSGWDINYENGTRTFTKADGSFTIYNNAPPSPPNPIRHLRISASGASVAPYNFDFPFTSPFTITFPSDYNLTLNNQTVAIGQTQNFSAQNKITASNFVLDGNGTTGGTVTMVAGKEIRMLPGTHIKAGSNFHAYIAPVPADCNDPVYARTANPENHIRNIFVTTKAEQSGEVKFLLSPSSSDNVQLFPNPAPTQILIQVTEEGDNNKDIPWQLFIYDISGKSIYQCILNKPTTRIDISDFASGIYLAKIMRGNICYTKKIIHQ
ncbi:MAG: T9SS type A sorting domain-containing protein [Bacteroidota bacterium]